MSEDQIESQFLSLIKDENEVETSHHVSIDHMGLFFHTYETAKHSNLGMGKILPVSIFAICALFLFVFRSPVPLLLSLLPTALGLLAATAISVTLWGSIHIFSLLIGFSLVCISVNYSIHYLTQRQMSDSNWDSADALQQIIIAITFGLLTSIFCYLALVITPSPVLRQLALFSIIGLVFSYLTVVCWYPIILETPATPLKSFNVKILENYLAAWQTPSTSTYLNYVTPVFLLLISLLFISSAHYNDNIDQLQSIPRDLITQEQKITKTTGLRNDQNAILVSAKSEELLLQRLEQIHTPLNQFIQDGQIGGYRDITHYLPSQLKQRLNYSLITKLYINESSRLKKQDVSENTLNEIPYRPLLIDDFLASPTATNIAFLWLGKTNNGYNALVLLDSVKNKTGLKKWCNESPNLIYLNKKDLLAEIFSQYSIYLSVILAATFLAVLVLLYVRYPLILVFTTTVPCLVACFTALAFTGENLNIFNITALLFVFGISIDFSLFFAEKAYSKTSLLAISLSAVTFLLLLGILTFSEINALQSYGLTLSVGVLASWFLAPLAARIAFDDL